MHKKSLQIILFLSVTLALMSVAACAPQPPVASAQPVNTPTTNATATVAATISNEFPTIAHATDISTLTPLPTNTPSFTATPTATVPPADTPTLAPTNTSVPPTRTPTHIPTRTPRPATAAPTATAVPVYPMDAAAQRVFELTNAERARQGLPALRLNPNLISAAGWFAQDMAANEVNSLSHTDSLGRDAPTRISQFGYRWLYFAENIAMGYPTADAVMAGWMGSEGHRENILNPTMNEIGIGHVQANGWDYWVEDFGAR